MGAVEVFERRGAVASGHTVASSGGVADQVTGSSGGGFCGREGMKAHQVNWLHVRCVTFSEEQALKCEQEGSLRSSAALPCKKELVGLHLVASARLGLGLLLCGWTVAA